MLVSLSELLDAPYIETLLESFRCSKNTDLQDFLHNKALSLEVSHHARTYILFSQEGKIEGFFSLALNILETKGLSKTRIKKLSTSHNPHLERLPCMILGQLGKDDRSTISGGELLRHAIAIIEEGRRYFGGKFVLIDSINVEKVIKFYERHLFKALPIDNDGLIKMVRFFN
ncbi:hypothetical protein NHP21005_19190 (plasmid) [Helicobacter sp. NHP21005]|uniref:hypothetical protein n=1 Tax=Helicobacter felistomachi TaxID=3040201 RepID=UPI00257224E3|nr:hypothetical protein [Helicobacter sp. NHP21005]BEG58210.1 hypothetical protein NHP21005_18980 [Helicobacter sp. NHP21005]BEG58231.1 hypothetical protein NHP21005_19190 [Helicobacter sp. NHP21005]